MRTSAGAHQQGEMQHRLVDIHCQGIEIWDLCCVLMLFAALPQHLLCRAGLTISLHLLVGWQDQALLEDK